MPVAVTNSKLIYNTIKACDVKIISALSETWLVHLIRMAADLAVVLRLLVARKQARGQRVPVLQCSDLIVE